MRAPVRYKGVALPAALWMLIIIAALGTIFLIFMSWSYLSASKLKYDQGAYYIANSGIMEAKAKLDTAGLTDGEVFTTADYIYGTAEVTVKEVGVNWVITSVGRYSQGGKTMAARTIRATWNSGGEIVQWENL